MREAQRKIRKSKSCGFLYLPRGLFEQLVSSEPTCADDPLVHVRPQVRASHRAVGLRRRVSSLTLLTGMNCVPRRLRLCFSHRSQRRVVRVRKSLHLMFTERCWIMLRCKPGEAWGDRGRSSPRLAERCDGAVDQCRDVGENVVPRRVLTPAGHRADDRREVTRRIRADRLVPACVDWRASSRIAPLQYRADQKPHRMLLPARARVQYPNAVAAGYVDAGTPRRLLAGRPDHASAHPSGYATTSSYRKQ